MNKILRCDSLPERERWSYLARSGLPAMFRKNNLSESHIINPLLTKLVRSRYSVHEVKMAGYWPSSFFACLWTETKSSLFGFVPLNRLGQ